MRQIKFRGIDIVNGKEIYEGDWCLDEDGKEFKAVFEPAFFATSTLKT